MSEIFGYSDKDGRHWFVSEVYNETVIEGIKDPEGGSAINLPTAIPSPFARLDLVRIAFENIGRTAGLKKTETEGDVIASAEDERLVSATLDMLELFYYYSLPEIHSNLKLVRWNVKDELKNLLADPAQEAYGDALSLYINQDNGAYNFHLAGDLYIIKYKLEVIGVTSPVTLFCPSAADLERLNVQVAGRQLFAETKPLYVRDYKFQEFCYYYFKKFPLLSLKMPAMEIYLRKNKAVLSQLRGGESNAHYERVKLIENDLHVADQDFMMISLPDKSPVSIFNLGADKVGLMMLNTEIEKKRRDDEQKSAEQKVREKARKSGFAIQSTRVTAEDVPLVLTQHLDDQILYIDNNWSNDTPLSYVYQQQPAERLLPGYKIKYPHLVISDFIEPTLVRVVYPISKRFFNGNYNASAGQTLKGYLLPLKLSFFNYFSVDELLSGQPGTPSITLEQIVGDSVTVRLSIPIAGGHQITYERMYSEMRMPKASSVLEAENQGLIIEHQVGLTLFPFIKTGIPALNAFYRVQLIDRDVDGPLENSDYRLNFFRDIPEKSALLEVQERKRSSKKVNYVSTKYYSLNQEFDFMQLKSDLSNAIIIPAWQPFQQGNVRFEFAIDFGTTNTHMEYRTAQSPNPMAFDITTDQEIQIATLYDRKESTDDFAGSNAIAISEAINEEFVPFNIGKQFDYRFPQRTVLAKNENITSNETEMLADYNIPFIYEKKSFAFNSNFETDLKWSKYNTENFNKIRAYFEELIFLIRNKVLLNKGKLEDTSLIWFYPTSMQPNRIANLAQLWEQTVRKFMPEKVVISSMPESLAPFYYYKFSNIIPGGNFTPSVSIDIGGGTSDVVIFKNNNPLYLTSFKFAANTLFGDAFLSIRKDDKGLLGKYLPHFRKELNTSKYASLLAALEQVIIQDKSADINAFLFSLENNSKIDDKNLFSYDQLLNNDENLKVVFLYFFASIIYHVASWMKVCGVELPNHIFLSGTGSKVLKIISYDPAYIEAFAARIFEKVYETKLNTPLKIITDLNIPKEATCKGGLLSLNQQISFDLKEVKKVLNFNESGPTNAKMKYEDLTPAIKSAVVTEVKAFNDMFIHLNDDEFFYDHFSVSAPSFNYFKKHMNNYLEDLLADGINYNLSLDMEQGQEKALEESLFFLPLTGLIYGMNNALAELE